MGFIDRLLRRRHSDRAAFRHLSRRADAERDRRCFASAATLYAEALRLQPSRGDLHIQHGHMLKESGDYAGAGAAYEAARVLRPEDADLQLQIGHLYRLAGRAGLARDAYRRAAMLRPGWNQPARELASLDTETARSPDGSASPEPLPPDMDTKLQLAPELAPGTGETAEPPHEGLRLHRFGRLGRGFDGVARTMKGVEAVHGWCLSATEMTSVMLLVDGAVLIEAATRRVAPPVGAAHLSRCVFNLWFDAASIPPGMHYIEVRCRDEGEDLFRHAEMVRVIAGPADNIDTNSAVPVREADPVRLAETIRALPSVLRPAGASFAAAPIRSVLAIRTDQLGDLIASIPALQELRAFVPEARLVGLVGPANEDLARKLGIFDEVLTVDFPDVPAERRRVMPLAAQEALRARLAPYAFDLAIDLAESTVSRPLLLLSGARLRYGAGADDWPWLDGAMSLRTRDPRNGLDVVPHGAKVSALVAALGALLQHRPVTIPLAPPPAAADRYVVLHAGARLAFSRWPHFGALAARLLQATNRKVVLIAVDAGLEMPDGLADDDRFRLIEAPLPFDEFDALVAGADLLIGNDSGPKHLAALRGVPAVTLYSARVNWQEWGQEQGGVTISRRVPCAGCAIFHDPEDCGRDFACIRDIRVDEVMQAIIGLLTPPR